MEVTPMKQKLLFLALMALGSQTLPHWRGGYYGGFGYGGPGFGISIGGPGYYSPYGYYGYGPYYGGPFDAVASVAGAAITADAIRSANRDPYAEDNKARRTEIKRQIISAQHELDDLEPNSSAATAKQKEISKLKAELRVA